MNTIRGIKHLFPKGARDKVRTHWQDLVARRAFHSAASRDFSPESIATLREAWGNVSFSARDDYLCAVSDYARRANVAILECGTGLTTALMAAVANVPIYCLEHSPEWAEFIDRRLRQLHLSAAVIRSKLQDYGAFDWYEIPSSLPDEFDLVVCDGPPGTTRGGRYGLVPLLGERIHRAAVLLDDAHRPQEREIITRWESESKFKFLHHASGYAFRPRRKLAGEY
jgi:hypothetical protein